MGPMGQLVYADRSGRGKLRFAGPQRAWFLHQIMTQAFEDMAPGEARDTAMITAHGRMLGYLEVVATEDALLAHFEADLVATLPDEIARYVFATRVEIEDVSAEMGLVLVAGDGWERATAAGAIVHPTASLGIPATDRKSVV
jgi:folate-binding Fe-S cluster repair protein YgfZ